VNKVSRRDRTSKALVRSRVMWVLWQSSNGRVFPEGFGFPLSVVLFQYGLNLFATLVSKEK